MYEANIAVKCSGKNVSLELIGRLRALVIAPRSRQLTTNALILMAGNKVPPSARNRAIWWLREHTVSQCNSLHISLYLDAYEPFAPAFNNYLLIKFISFLKKSICLKLYNTWTHLEKWRCFIIAYIYICTYEISCWNIIHKHQFYEVTVKLKKIKFFSLQIVITKTDSYILSLEWLII